MAQVTEAPATPGRVPGAKNVQVEWGLTPVPDFPEKRSGGFVRNAALHSKLEQIEDDVTMHGQVYEIGTYDDPDEKRARTAASAKASDLRKKYKEGWEFRVGDSNAAGGCVGLFARFQ